MDMLVTNIVAAAVFSVLGVALFVAAFWLLDRLSPYSLWKEILDEHNTALAILIGLVALGLSIIIAAAVN